MANFPKPTLTDTKIVETKICFYEKKKTDYIGIFIKVIRDEYSWYVCASFNSALKQDYKAKKSIYLDLTNNVCIRYKWN